MKKFYDGDNLQILREHIADESVDLSYVDPPFNSIRDCSLLFNTPEGHESDALRRPPAIQNAKDHVSDAHMSRLVQGSIAARM